MKRFLSLLASFGLLAVSGANVIACGSANGENNKEINITVAPFGDDFVIRNIEPIRVDLATSPKEDISATQPISNDLLGRLVFADANGNKFRLDDDSKIVVKAVASNDIKAGNREADVKFSIIVNNKTLESIGILNKDGTRGKNADVRLETINNEGNLAKEICSFKLIAQSFISTLNEPSISGEATIISSRLLDVDAEFIPPSSFTDNMGISIKDVNDLSDNVAWCSSTWVTKDPNSDKKLYIYIGSDIPNPTSVEQKFIITFCGFKGSATLTILPVETAK